MILCEMAILSYNLAFCGDIMPKNLAKNPTLIAHAQHLAHTLSNAHNLRSITDYAHLGEFIIKDNAPLLNLTSNDYLGLAGLSHAIISPHSLHDTHIDLHKLDTHRQKAKDFGARFWEFSKAQGIGAGDLSLGSGSSRLLSGGTPVWESFEAYLQEIFAPKSALLFNSGYHCNVSCIAALGRLEGVGILIDEYAHASMFDGLLQAKAMSKALWWRRFRHNDMAHLQELLESTFARFRHIIIISEGVFSMDGDVCDLQGIVALKHRYDNVLIYLDEAHSLGVVGENGLGLAKSLGLCGEVDFLIFTFGKALGSMGACMLCAKELKELFINTARGLIYSTALPPLSIAFSFFAFCELWRLGEQREYLRALGKQARSKLESTFAKVDSREEAKKLPYVLGEWHIISLVLGDNATAIECQDFLESCGIFAKAIKSPTIPQGTARIRFSLNASLSTLEPLYQALEQYANRFC